MKRLLIVFTMLAIMLSLFTFTAYAAGFSSDADAIEKAAKSVLYLEMFNIKKQLIGNASGFVAFESNIMVTNYHVIDGAYYITAYDDDGKSYNVSKVLCADEDSDIAICAFEKDTNLEPLTLKAYDNLKRGEAVLTIGSPEGIMNTVSTGIISNSDNKEIIQITAPISPGSSGGALFNDDGYVIGVTAATYADGQNLNFAVNVGIVKAMYNAWNGKYYTLSNHLSSAKFDYANVYETRDSSQSITQTDEWTCLNCGSKNTLQFCTECGTEKLIWQCVCGKLNNSKFCGVCGCSISSLTEQANEAIGLMQGGQYEDAIQLLEGLGSFNSMSVVTDAGKYYVASEYIYASYYALAENALSAKEFDKAAEYYACAGSYSDAKSKINSAHYEKAEYLASLEKYDEAIRVYETIKSYSDSAEKIRECYYLNGKKLLNLRKYDDAVKEFKLSDGYSDAKNMISLAYYLKGVQLYDNGAYDDAITAFENAGSYSDAETKVLSCYYAIAENYLTEKDFDKAYDSFKLASGYADADERMEQTLEAQRLYYYDLAEESYNSENYMGASKYFELAGNCKDAPERIKQSNYMLGMKLMKSKRYTSAKTYFIKAGDYLDASEQAKEAQYQQAIMSNNDGSYDDAIELLSDIRDYKDADNLYNTINYSRGEHYLRIRLYEKAIGYFTACKGYSDSEQKILECKQSKLDSLIEQNKYEEAYKYYKTQLTSDMPLEDCIIAQPGSSGTSTAYVLKLAREMSFGSGISKDASEYKKDYAWCIKKMETNFGLVSDGIIYLSEMQLIYDVIYPGQESSEIATLLERVSDLGYLDSIGKLPDSHSKYESKYTYGVKAMEKALGLTADGFLTRDEIAVVKAQTISAPAAITTLNLTQSDTAVSISWSSSKGAKWYEVYRNSTLIATVTGTYYKDTEPVMGKSNSYSVKACKYNKKSASKFAFIDVEIVYKWVSVKNLVNNFSDYNGKYVRINNVTKVKGYWDDKDYYMVSKATIDGKTYYIALIFGNHDNWNWSTSKTAATLSKGKSISGAKGQVTKKQYFSDYGNLVCIDLSEITW